MARFRGTVQGDRGEASRLGCRGLVVEAHGWTIGVRVECTRDAADNDVITVYSDGGSGKGQRMEQIAYLTSNPIVPKLEGE